ncbi:MAG: non-ribosomal peptide synthetase, partial [Flavobacteriales bacterium]|nr:non-ribosomal peptide synthetase [Flavobacteriales bacterium]
PEQKDVALILLTSGSTSTPKLVPLTHENLHESVQNLVNSLEVTSEDRCLNMMTMFHVGGLIDLLLAPLSIGAEVLCPDHLDSKTFFKNLHDFSPTWFQCVPTMLFDILRTIDLGLEELPADNSLRFIRSVSAPLSKEVFERVEEKLGIPVIEIYGMTETAGLISSNPLPPRQRKVGSVGLNQGDTQIQIIDKQNNPLSSGQVGEVIVKGKQLFSGYMGSESQNKELFIGQWFKTGDLGYLDKDGHLYLKGRVKDIVNRGGEKISLQEIDEIMLSHPDVIDAAAFAIHHPTLGEEVAAAVVLDSLSEVSIDDIRDFLSEYLTAFKRPRVISSVDNLPRNSGGKLQRHLLTKNFESDLDENIQIELGPSTDLEIVIAKLWKNILDVKEISRHDDFFSLGGDSLRAVIFIDEFERSTGYSIDPKVIYEQPVLEDLSRYIEQEEGYVTPREQGTSSGLYKELARLMALWPGVRLDQDSLIVGRNTMGSKTPIFWCTNSLDHFEMLVKYLDPDQPIHGMVTLMESKYRSAENNQKAAHIYAQEIIKLCPEQDIVISAWCEGAKIVIDLANEVREAGVNVVLLFIQDNFIPKLYDGPTAFYFTKLGMKRYREQYFDPDFGIGKYFTGGFTTFSDDIEHVAFYKDPSCIKQFAQMMPSMIEESINVLVNSSTQRDTIQKQILREDDYKAHLVLQGPPFSIHREASCSFNVEVKNMSKVTWTPSEQSGIILMVSWLNYAYKVEAKKKVTFTQALAPGEKMQLAVRLDPPPTDRTLKISFLRVDLVDDGIAFFSSYGSKAVQFPTLSSSLMLYPVIISDRVEWVRRLDKMLRYKVLRTRSLPVKLTNRFVKVLRWGRDLTYKLTE